MRILILFFLTFGLCDSMSASIIVPISLNDIRALAQSADVVVIARIEKFRPGQPSKNKAGVHVEGTPALFVCDVEKTLAGAVPLNGKRHFTYDRGGDFYSWKVTNKRFLLFLRHGQKGYKMCAAPWLLEGQSLSGWFEGREFNELLSLHEVLPLIKKHIGTKVQFFGWVPRQAALKDEELPTSWIFKNVGRNEVIIFPPSWCFNSLISRRLRQGKWYVKREWWQSVDHWDFYQEQDVPVSLLPGEQHIFYYQIPLKELKITENGQYKITFYYHQDQLSQHADKAEFDESRKYLFWIGEPPRMSQVVQVN